MPNQAITDLPVVSRTILDESNDDRVVQCAGALRKVVKQVARLLAGEQAGLPFHIHTQGSTGGHRCVELRKEGGQPTVVFGGGHVAGLVVFGAGHGPDLRCRRMNAADQFPSHVGMDVIVSFTRDQQHRSVSQTWQPPFQNDIPSLP